MKIAVLSLICVGIFLPACSQPKPKGAQKHYPLTGKVVSVDANAHTALIDAAAIPNYMDAMKMDYPIASPAELAALRAGETISATVDVNEDGSYSLSNVRGNSPGNTGK